MAEFENKPTSAETPESKPNANDQIQESINKAKAIAQKLTNTEKAIAGGALIVIAGSFFPAYSYVTPYYQYSQNNLYSGLGWINFIAAIAALALIVLPQLNIKIPALPWPNNKILFGASVVAGICSIVQLFNYVFDGAPAVNPSIGIFLVFAGSLLMAYTAYNEQKSHGTPTQTPPTPTSTSSGL